MKNKEDNKMEEHNNEEEFNKGFTVGGLLGLVLGVAGGVGLMLAVGPEVRSAKIFKEDNKPAAMRLYIKDCRDKILVEGVDEYSPLSVHLCDREPADRELEAARIKKQVRWYEE